MSESVTLSVEDARELAWTSPGDSYAGWTVAAKERLGDSRWESNHRLVIRDASGRHYAGHYTVGLTESQDTRPWEYETEAVFSPVIAQIRTVEITEYLPAPAQR
jgi:hypothetical protein